MEQISTRNSQEGQPRDARRTYYKSVADSGEGPWGAAAPPYFLTKIRPEGPKKILLGTAPPLSQPLDDRPPLI